MEFDYYKVFRRNLKTLMASKDLNGKLLAEAIGTTPATISRYLTKDRAPELSLVVKIAQYFGVTVDWMLGFNTDPKSDIPDAVYDVMIRYIHASDDDQKVIQTILSKYKGASDE